MSEENKKVLKKTPKAGHTYGFLYPVLWKTLECIAGCSLYRFLITDLPAKKNKEGSAICSDIYIVSWWGILLLSLFFATNSNIWIVGIVLTVCVYRYIEIMSVLLSILIRGFFNHEPRGQVQASVNRTLLLIVFNGLEIFILFAVFYICIQELWHPITIFARPIFGVLDSIYYSVITGTTLGYGDIFPVGGISKLICIIEVLTVFLVFVVVLAGIVSNRPGIPDLEHDRKPVTDHAPKQS